MMCWRRYDTDVKRFSSFRLSFADSISLIVFIPTKCIRILATAAHTEEILTVILKRYLIIVEFQTEPRPKPRGFCIWNVTKDAEKGS
jgi:hypothetical protein